MKMKKDKTYYLSKGFDDATAAYFASGRRRITRVVANDDFTLTITFDNNEEKLLDAKSFLVRGTVFDPLFDIESFKRVYLDENSVVSWDINPNVDSKKVWSNKIDISSDMCYLESSSIC